MPNLFATGAALLERTRTQFLASRVIYTRGGAGGPGILSIECPATIGRSVYRSEDANGVITELEVRDYLILAADLCLGGMYVEPKAGDRITEVVAFGPTRVFQVSPPPTNEAAWRWSDEYHLTRRIHTKYVGNA